MKNLLVKLVIFSVMEGRLRVFLPEDNLPFEGLMEGRSLDETARKILKVALGFFPKESYLEQLYTFSFQNKIIVAYYALVPEYRILEGRRKGWVEYSKKLDSSTFQESIRTPGRYLKDLEVIRYAVQRLGWKVEYTNVVYSLLPEKFTLGELQTIYEAILGRKLDKRNFRKKILSLKILKSTGKKKKLGKARPAEMFSFTKRKLTFVEVL